MCKLLKFPTQKKLQRNLPRRRVFYIGYRYVGPMFCQDIQQLYLKRKGRVNGVRMWSLITYGKYDESDKRKYSIELEQCSDEALFEMLNSMDIEDELDIGFLRSIGWEKNYGYSAEIINIHN